MLGKRRRVDTIMAHRARKRRRLTRRRGRRQRPIGMELKFFDSFLVDGTLTVATDLSGAEQNPSATITPSTMGQGDQQNQRDGRIVVWKSI